MTRLERLLIGSPVTKKLTTLLAAVDREQHHDKPAGPALSPEPASRRSERGHIQRPQQNAMELRPGFERSAARAQLKRERHP
jgi:hypothetical protein